MKIGYARVSSSSQDTTMQEEALIKEGCEVIYSEKISGKNSKRPELQALLKGLRENDVICSTAIDRVARSLSDLFKISAEIEKKKADIKILNQNIDTSTPSGKLMFNIMGSFAEFERNLLISRTSSGLKRAKENGVILGRRKKINKEDERKMKKLWEAGESWNELAKTFKVSRQSIYNRIKKWKSEENVNEFVNSFG
tara:strand:- start:2987 stop:3577 length:591 start_codon:yes stop_codon:yes gene_type:complete